MPIGGTYSENTCCYLSFVVVCGQEKSGRRVPSRDFRQFTPEHRTMTNQSSGRTVNVSSIFHAAGITSSSVYILETDGMYPYFE